MARWQYQQRAEPISTDAEAVRVDKWLPTYPDRIAPRAGLLAAIAAGACFFLFTPAPGEALTIDKWIPTYPDRVEALKPGLPQGAYVVDPLQITLHESTFVDKWAPTYPDRLDRARRAFWREESVTDVYLDHVPVPVDITIDRWAPTYPSRLDRQPRPFWQGDFTVDPVQLTAPESLIITKWLPEYPSIVLGRARGIISNGWTCIPIYPMPGELRRLRAWVQDSIHTATGVGDSLTITTTVAPSINMKVWVE